MTPLTRGMDFALVSSIVNHKYRLNANGTQIQNPLLRDIWSKLSCSKLEIWK